MVRDITIAGERRRAIQIAGQLLYGKEVIEKIKTAKTSAEISNILKTARKGENKK